MRKYKQYIFSQNNNMAVFFLGGGDMILKLVFKKKIPCFKSLVFHFISFIFILKLQQYFPAGVTVGKYKMINT